MRKTASHMQPAQHVMKITTGTKNKTHWQFNVTISPTATMSRVRAKLLLKTAVSCLARSPYARYLNNKEVNIHFISDADPGFIKKDSIGEYDGISNTVFINCSKFTNWEPEYIRAVLVHELLHANSFESIISGNKNLTRFGIDLRYFSEEEGAWKTVTIEYRALNEGITEYLRVMAGGKEPSCDFKYYPAYKAIETIAKKVGLPNILEAYFKGEIQLLSGAINEMYGQDAFLHLNMLANHSVYYGREKQEELLGFAQYGYASYGKRYWRNEGLPPVLLAATELDGVEGVYTTCPQELLEVFSTADDPARHATEESFTLWKNYRESRRISQGKPSLAFHFLQVTPKEHGGWIISSIEGNYSTIRQYEVRGIDINNYKAMQPDERDNPVAFQVANLM